MVHKIRVNIVQIQKLGFPNLRQSELPNNLGLHSWMRYFPGNVAFP